MFSERDPLQITEKKVGLIHSCVNLVSVSVFAPCSSEKGACLFRNPTLLFFFFFLPPKALLMRQGQAGRGCVGL